MALIGLTVAPMSVVVAQEHGEETSGQPNLEVYVPDNQLVAGTSGEAAPLELYIQNDGELDEGTQRDRVTTARAVTVMVNDSGPFVSKTATTPIGAIQDGMTTSLPKQFDVPSDIEPGTYDITFDIQYNYTDSVSGGEPESSEDSETVTRTVTVEVTDTMQFSVIGIASNVEPGASGMATATIENIGNETATNAYGTFSPIGGGGIMLDGGAADVHVGDLDPGETTNVSFEVAADPAVSPGMKPIEAALTYEDDMGLTQEATPRVVPLEIGEGLSFNIDNIEDTLAVGYDGEITGTLRNDGPGDLAGGVLVAEPATDSIHIEDTRYALPDLDAGEATDFRFPADVGGQADAGPREIRFTIEYQVGGTVIESDPFSERVELDESSDEFSIEAVNATVGSGESSEIVLSITNERPETFSNIDALLYTDSPLSSIHDEAFVSELGPGESAEIRFEIAAEDTMTEPRPIELDFEYETERGATVLSDAYTVGVDIVEPEQPDDDDGILSMGMLALVAVLLLAVGSVVAVRRYA